MNATLALAIAIAAAFLALAEGVGANPPAWGNGGVLLVLR